MSENTSIYQTFQILNKINLFEFFILLLFFFAYVNLKCTYIYTYTGIHTTVQKVRVSKIYFFKINTFTDDQK